jgi:hypothetical protein
LNEEDDSLSKLIGILENLNKNEIRGLDFQISEKNEENQQSFLSNQQKM